MPSARKRITFSDYVFDIPEDVYEPSEDSYMFAENLSVNEGDYVLDLGTGCGVLAIIAAEKAKNVVAVDLNPIAVRCARENAKRNHLADKISFLEADLFSPFKETAQFDLILFNAPYLPVERSEDSLLDLAWAGGKKGRKVIDRFISAAPGHLKQTGRLLLLQSTLSNVSKTFHLLEEKDLKPSILAERCFPMFEKLVLLQASH